MRSISSLKILAVATLAGALGWYAARHWPAPTPGSAVASGAARRVHHYQCSMHPQIKSDHPGRCTICGMELSPILEGARGFDVGEGMVLLPSNSVQVIHVQTGLVTRRPLRRAFRFAGIIEDNDARHRVISALVDGRIDRLFVNFVGAEVHRGQPLATLYSPTLLLAEREYLVLHEQLRRGDAPALAAERGRMFEAAAQRLRRLGLSEAQISKLPGKAAEEIHTELEVPVSGTVVARNVYEGQYVKEGEKLFEIADFSTMWFLFDAYEGDLVWLKPGQKVSVTTPAVPGKLFSGIIGFIDPSIRELTRSAKVRVELSNPLLEEGGRERRELYHKLYAEAMVQTDIPEVLAVVRCAVLSPGPAALVYVDRGGGSYEQRRVKLGRAGDDDWEIISGLQPGERVVTSGNMLIDAQAQLNAGSAPLVPDASAAAPSADGPIVTLQLDAAGLKAVNTFLVSASAVAEALAADRLADFNRHRSALLESVRALREVLGREPSWAPALGRVEAAARFELAADLAGARHVFVPFSLAAADLAGSLRRQPEFSRLKIYQCPMLKRAVPGAPAVGRWLQTQEPLRNPFFGSEMLDCGEEVKP